jgi:hypothetical protein
MNSSEIPAILGQRVTGFFLGCEFGWPSDI